MLRNRLDAMNRQTTLFPFTLLLLVSCFSVPAFGQKMDNEQLEKILKISCEEVKGESGMWQLVFKEHFLLVLTDETNNRMRIFTPIIEEDQLKKQQLRNMLAANFHSALDAKYALYEGYVVSVFTHPLKELGKAQLKDALQQVVSLSQTFGTTYSSTELIFGPGSGENAPGKSKERLNKRPDRS